LEVDLLLGVTLILERKGLERTKHLLQLERAILGINEYVEVVLVELAGG